MAYAGDIDGLVLMVMCDEPGPWTQEELRREFREGVEAADALGRLRRRGLVVELEGGFYVATAAGRYAHAMEESS
jgi:hypothetical protein